MTITRYEMVRGYYDRHQMAEQDDGDYVLHTDHLAAMAEVERAAWERGVRDAAQTAFCHSDNRPRRYSMDWNDGYIDGCRGANEAILALLTQEGR